METGVRIPPEDQTPNQNDMAQTQSKTEAAALRKFLNKREEIAAHVLAGLVQNPAFLTYDNESHAGDLATMAIACTDALLQQLYIREDKTREEAGKA